MPSPLLWRALILADSRDAAAFTTPPHPPGRMQRDKDAASALCLSCSLCPWAGAECAVGFRYGSFHGCLGAIFLGLEGPTRKPRRASIFRTRSDTQAVP